MYRRVDGKPCNFAWQLKVWKLNKKTGEYELESCGPPMLTLEEAKRELRRKHITPNNRQYNLYECKYYKGQCEYERKIMVKDETGMYYDPEPIEDYD